MVKRKHHSYGVKFPIPCGLCGKIFNSLNTLRMHIHRGHKNTTYSKYMFNYHGISVDISRKERRVNYKCVLCGRLCKTLTGLARHLKCSHVGTSYDEYLQENLGIRRTRPAYETAPDGEKSECGICGKSFLNLMQHVSWRHPEWASDEYKRHFGSETQTEDFKKRVCLGIRHHSERVKGLSLMERLSLTLGEDARSYYDRW